MQSQTIATACASVLPENAKSFNVDNVRCCKVLGGGVTDTAVVNGFVLPKNSHGMYSFNLPHVVASRCACSMNRI